MAFLKEQGIGTGIHYPIPLHLQKAYERMGHQKGDFPICEKVAGSIVSLPMFPQLKSAQQQRVVEATAEFVGAAVARSLVDSRPDMSHHRCGRQAHSGVSQPSSYFYFEEASGREYKE